MSHPESFVYKRYKGYDVELPLTDDMRKFLIARSKDTFIQECDEVWANFQNKPQAEPEEALNLTGDEDDEYVTYGELNKDELIAEIKDRNEGRDAADQLATSGTKPELIKRLEDDDAASDEETTE